MARTRRLIRKILPPIVVDALRAIRPKRREFAPEWEYLPGGWPRSPGPGWENETILRAQMAGWSRFLESVKGTEPLDKTLEGSPDSILQRSEVHHVYMTFAYVLALAGRCRERISLLDWGGGFGQYYALSRRLLPGVGIEYHCRDLEIFCKEGRKLFPEAHFYNDGSCFDRDYDLVVASSSLQYSEQWREVATQLAWAAREYLYVARVPVVEKAPSFVVRQQPRTFGSDVQYPGWVFHRQDLLDHLRGSGMELLREFLVHGGLNVAGAPEVPHHRSFLFKRASLNQPTGARG